MAVDVKQPKGYRKAWNGGKPPEPNAAELDFHRHLDTCPHCQTHPFDLCVMGADLLVKATTPGAAALRDPGAP